VRRWWKKIKKWKFIVRFVFWNTVMQCCLDRQHFFSKVQCFWLKSYFQNGILFGVQQLLEELQELVLESFVIFTS
jgi:hypothetical protein